MIINYKNKTKMLFSLIFVVIISLYGSLSFLTHLKSIGGRTFIRYQNKLSDNPSILDHAEMMITECEIAFNESLLFKEKISKLATYSTSLVYGELHVESTQVLLGKNNWLFYKSRLDGDSIADYRGTNSFSVKKMEQLLEKLLKDKVEMEKKGIELVLFIAPNKEQVYSRYMPDSINRISSISRTDRFVDYIRKNSNLKVIYPKDTLVEKSYEYQVYYKYDTHWNAIGAFFGFQELVNSLYQQKISLNQDDVIIENNDKSSNFDLPRMINMEEYFNDGINYKIETDFFGTKSNDKVLVVGDSFGYGLAPYLESYFSNYKICHRNEYKDFKQDIDGADVIVLEYVERYIERIVDFSL